MGGRGRGGGGAGATVRAVANALGIARHEMAAYQQQQPSRSIEPPLYPILTRSVMELDMGAEQSYMAHLKLEIANRFHESEFYLDQNEKKDIRRYLDKFTSLERDKLQPDFTRLPEELCWRRSRTEILAAKRRKVDISGEEIAEKLKKLEEKETEGEDEKEEQNEEEGSEKSELAEGEPGSEDDNLDDDYNDNHFDNGEAYDASDDNMDGDEY